MSDRDILTMTIASFITMISFDDHAELLLSSLSEDVPVKEGQRSLSGLFPIVCTR